MELNLKTKARVILSVVVLAASTWACDADEPEPDPIKVPVFELEVDESYLTDDDDYWIIISNEDGKIIAFAPYHNGDDIELKADENDVGDKISLTTLRHAPRKGSFNELYQLSTYIDIEVGEKMILTHGTGTPFTGTKTPVNLEFSNLPDRNEREVVITSTGVWANGYLTGGTDNEATYTVQVGLPHSDLFVAVTSFEAPRYLELDLTETAGGAFDFLTDFKIFDHVFVLPTPSFNYYVSILGYRDATPGAENPTYRYHSQSFYRNNNYGQLQVGYNDGYDRYSTSWSVALSDGSTVEYSKTGTAPEAADFEIPDLDFTVINFDINEFEYTSDDEFTYRSSVWIFGDFETPETPYLSWSVFSPAGSNHAVIREFTDSLDVVFPYLNAALGDLEYVYSSFVKNTDGLPYEYNLSKTNSFGEQGLVEKELFTKKKHR